jgi:hypothetical protein
MVEFVRVICVTHLPKQFGSYCIRGKNKKKKSEQYQKEFRKTISDRLTISDFAFIPDADGACDAYELFRPSRDSGDSLSSHDTYTPPIPARYIDCRAHKELYKLPRGKEEQPVHAASSCLGKKNILLRAFS